ncbi:MAG: DUF1287 domain-containing protein [Thermoanaerobaculia bacterium]|nr:DUF1287 domain-containing protein [Thermoanaerobaculia bacterium]
MRTLSLAFAAALFLAAPLVAQPPEDVVARVLEGAERQVGVTVVYDGSYRRLSYPGGDVPIERGVCTDVLVRAFRNAGIDLQVLVHEDLKRAFGAYPKAWGLSRPDRNIDHRRVPNLATFFARHGEVLPVSRDAADYRPGEVVTWRLPSGLPHVGLVSERTANGRPLVVHNVGRGAVFEDVLFAWPVTGRWRYPPAAASRPRP